MATKWRDPLMIKTMRQRAIRLTQLKKGPVRHPVLPEDLFLRVKAFKEILAEVDNMTLDEVIEDFARDAHPDSEIAVWERIANTYQLFLLHNPTNDLAIKHDVFSVLLMTSLGMHDVSAIQHLTQDEISGLILNYRGL